MQYILPTLITISAFILLQVVFYFLRKRDDKNRQIGINQVVSHIYSQIQTKGEIKLILDGVPMTVIEKK